MMNCELFFGRAGNHHFTMIRHFVAVRLSALSFAHTSQKDAAAILHAPTSQQ